MKQLLLNQIKSASNIAIFAHEKPDGDAVGSALALFSLCKEMGKHVSVSITGEMPNNLLFLKDIDVVNQNKIKSGDLCIVVDCANLTRLGKNRYQPQNFKNILMIDHHIKEDNFANYSVIKVGYSSTCEVIYDVLTDENIEITPTIAYYLLIGILTDTGGFKYACTTPETMIKTAKLLTIANININDLMIPLFSSITKEMFELKKLAYDKIKLYCNDTIAIINISNDELKEINVNFADTKIVLEIAQSLKSVKAVALVTEGEPGVNYVSFRSKGVDISLVANVFGGGGHKESSGCKIFDTNQNATKEVTEAVLKYMERQ